jgi:phosphatidylglycerophosphate synthase
MRVESHLRVDRDSFFTITSYGITFIRLLIAFFGGVMILRGDDVKFGVASIALVMAFDYFDGATFNRTTFSTIKEWRMNRRVLDSVFDRLVIQIVCIPLLISNSSFVWLYLLILSRELAISGYISKQFTQGLLVYPRLLAKIACATVGITVISFLAFPFSVTFISAGMMIALSVSALIDYIHRVGSFNASSPVTKTTDRLEEIF